MNLMYLKQLVVTSNPDNSTRFEIFVLKGSFKVTNV